ncbi:hypothetical protein RSOLAG1IB_02807 [Rhizoctonia solani AG-1 IB]|uniref:Uncharacterized protein n=1 Tax=Thanatephorus cucumeris (strain AG1-IB / isolate 7/3/14) TaxID=1108050 RepID=A0A0B7FPK5_THACB|nr:hypothetical protein RSOLAG1IB_02807 [Rhizoctonia solani AG-1 IB]
MSQYQPVLLRVPHRLAGDRHTAANATPCKAGAAQTKWEASRVRWSGVLVNNSDSSRVCFGASRLAEHLAGGRRSI